MMCIQIFEYLYMVYRNTQNIYLYVITYIYFVYMFKQYTLEHFAKDTLNLS